MIFAKNFICYIDNGIAAERKFTQFEKGEILFNQAFETKMVPFAMDAGHEEFIIFRIDREKEPGLYIWVYLQGEFKGKKIRLTMVNELMLFSKWTGEPMDVSGIFPDDVITKAIQMLQTWTDKEIWAEMKELDRWMNEGGNSPMWVEDEAHILEDAETAKKEHNGLLYMY